MTEDPEGAFDPFAGLTDAPDPGPAGTLTELLDSARRGFVPIRKVFVQRPRGEAERGSVLAKLVSGRHQRPLDALLLLHALQPVLDPIDPLGMSTWARILSTRSVCTPNAATKAFTTLIELGLVTRTEHKRRPIINPLLEDGSGSEWVKAGSVSEQGPGYFTLPHEYWTEGYVDRLTLPGKAMLLIMLAATNSPKTPTFEMPVERARDWYGISERTAERGYRELSREGLLLIRSVKVADARHPAGRREVYHRALKSPFSTPDRDLLQKAASAAKSGQLIKAGLASAASPGQQAGGD